MFFFLLFLDIVIHLNVIWLNALFRMTPSKLYPDSVERALKKAIV